jgi:hypothetical protein
MRRLTAFSLVAATVTTVLEVHDAAACGGCFAPPAPTPSQVTQITGEKMLLTMSKQQTTLYDEITYSGNPSDFAWVLPIKGVATVGLSSDALFQQLGADTQANIFAPQINCPQQPYCGNAFDAGASATFTAAASSSGGGPPPVTVISQEVVGPYDTVQLASTDPMALRDWLAMHGYNVPASDGPVIDEYVAEGFNFLALKLVPGMGVNTMKPVRVTTMGATPNLPLRMVAVGSGAIVPITLWVLAEGRYDTVNLPSFTLDPTSLVWDWDTSDSNYSVLKQNIFTNSSNRGWLVEAGEPYSMYQLQAELQNLVQSDPVASGYADAMGMNAAQNFADDMTTLFSGLNPTSAWITRFEGALSHAALSADLQVAAASNQTPVQRTFYITNTTGTPPACPPVYPCDDGTGAGGVGTTSGAGGSGGPKDAIGLKGSSCAMGTHGSGGDLLSGGLVVAAIALARRRRRA